MNDVRERLERRREVAEGSDKRELRERKRSQERELLCGDLGPERRGLGKAREELQRLERISDRDSMRFTRGFDPSKVRELEDLEIKMNPEGFVSRHRDEALDPATRREVCERLEKRR